MYGYGYGDNNYGYGSPSFGVGAAGGIFVTLLAIGFIAAIVLAVVVYRKYASDGNEQPLEPRRTRARGGRSHALNRSS